MTPTQTVSLPDFDTLMRLHRCNPEAYEALRVKLLEDCIANAPVSQQASANRLLSRMEAVRTAAQTPLQAAVAAAMLMVESVVGLQAPLEELLNELANYQAIMLLDRLRTAR